MIRNVTALLFLMVTSFFYSCSLFQPTETVVLSPRLAELEHKSFAIIPFADKRTGSKDNFGFNVTDVVTDAFETAYMKSGSRIVERGLIDRVLAEMKFSYQGDVDQDQLKEIGKLTNSSVVIFGMIREFKKAKYQQVDGELETVSCVTLSYSVKAVHIQTGEVLWKGSITRNSGLKGDFLSPCDCNAVRFADRTSRVLVKKILSEAEAVLGEKEGVDLFPSNG
ncbi:MAG: CsgG/HfaB family protein [Desulfobacterales bacterium]|nr:CsgG/HfaB family protein [Desulfobacterales bacterium]